MSLPVRARLVEVGPRDGLQNEAVTIAPDIRVKFIERLAAAGLREIEAGAFVSERRVPQMAGTAEVLATARPRVDALLSALAPNLQGLRDAMQAGAGKVAILVAASESFSRRNLNCGIDESLARAGAIAAEAHRSGIRLRGYISCALVCPFEGEIDPARVVEMSRELHKLGCEDIVLGDTIGAGTPLRARRLVERVARDAPLERLVGHFHDTYGQALANIFACLETGLSAFDCSVAGLGGCPFAPGAAGNVATEDVVYMLQGAGVETGVDLERLVDAGAFICKYLGHSSYSRVAIARAARDALPDRTRTE